MIRTRTERGATNLTVLPRLTVALVIAMSAILATRFWGVRGLMVALAASAVIVGGFVLVYHVSMARIPHAPPDQRGQT